MNKFKAGDKVYYPQLSAEVLTIHKSNSSVYPIHVTEHDFNFTIEGKYLSGDTAPCLIPATPENHKLLEQLYGVEFEAPPVKPTSKDIIKAMLDDGWKYVPCLVSDKYIVDCASDLIEYDLIMKVLDDSFKSTLVKWYHAFPVDPRTGKLIIDYVDGQIVTE